MTSAKTIPSMMLCFLLFIGTAGVACSAQSDDGSVPQGTDTLEVQEGVPTLVDLGSLSCVPCQMMEEELARLEELTGDRLVVSFIDINQDRDAASQYGVRVIPTQVYLAPDGTELARHEGFISAEQMLSQWTELGYDVSVAVEEQNAP